MKQIKALFRPILLGLGALTLTSQVQAIGIDSTGILPGMEQAQPVPQTIEEQQSRTDWQTARYSKAPGQMRSEAGMELVEPFGSHLFNGGFSGVRADGLNTTYRLVPGDQVTLRVWGAVEIERILPVDAQGNIFIPGIGPVKVQGSTNGELNSKVTSAVKSVYPEGVQVYTNLQGVQPVAVFVTGYVEHPGRYAGTPTDSLLYFIDQAGGIDSRLGSYRNIIVKRNNEIIATADLYDFLLNGKMPTPQFRDGDTIVISERGPAVVVTGDVERDYRYELQPNQMTGSELLALARTKSDVSHVLLRGNRKNRPISVYLPVEELSQQALRSGDEVLFSSDQRDETIVVQLEGSFYGPSRYALPKDARLQELLDAIAVPQELTDTRSISLRRLSVAEQQKEALKDSLRRLETNYLSAPSSTPEEADIRIKEAELIGNFVARASEVEPNGRLVVSHDDQISNIRLQDGDIITLPEYRDSILVSGEVLVPQSMVYKQGLTVMDYIESSGGFSQHADDENILVVRMNGELRKAEDVTLKPGDEVLVLPLVPTKNLQLATSISQIVYQIAVATKVALDL
ncbi:polysaccharide biosynthesis/export family protein [Marinobacterium lutimaris]|uniref:Protein involved in polysaccharide export, contains SLBB domain of the beta-grasp fold n=1 Tax=Marinobacterium lutimaris TaxID=568106 RepID=A0A1H6B3I0_9GAMM|nr:polysaccharide biosynthesis/export family protein [Marinobacterium lutimaris]SEG55162.1 protein involved in polysaccharide export, contains SLBB domain of the beta-grasp fold [Marinobacterium lutimaris]